MVDTNKRERVLIVSGTSGNTGSKLVHALSEQTASRRPIIFAFCLNPDELEQSVKERCNGLIVGNFESYGDITRAMEKSQATTVLFIPPKPTDDGSQTATSTSGSKTSPLLTPPSPQAALDAVLSHPQHRKVTFFILPHKQLRKGGKLKDALGGVSQFWSGLQGVTCSVMSNELLMNSSERSLCSTSSFRKRQKIKKKASPLTDMNETCTPVQDATASGPELEHITPSSVHIKIHKKKLVEFVVGAVMDSDSISSLKGIGHPRDITVVTE
jgi:hypothetical protein